MPRPKNKPELQQLSQKNFDKLLELVAKAPQDRLDEPGVCENWSTKDVLAHLHGWHQMALDWHKSGLAGQKPNFLPNGYTWKETPQVNENIYQKYKDADFEDILKKLKQSHEQVMKVIDGHTDAELFTKAKYDFTGSTSLGSYLVSATSSHYDWATSHIKKYFK